MPGTPYNGNPAGPGGGGVSATLIIPDDGDVRGAAGLGAPLEQIADDIACLQQMAGTSVASVAALRAISIPINPQALGYVRLTPESNGNVVTGLPAPPGPVRVGGVYYYDPAYNVLDNSSSAIRPASIGAGNPGMWRLVGGPLFTIIDQPNLGGGSAAPISAAPGTSVINGVGYNFAPGVEGGGPALMYAGDLIELEATVELTVQVTTSGTVSGRVYFTKNSPTAPLGSYFNFQKTVPTNELFNLVLRTFYVVTPADVASGTLILGMSIDLINALGVGAFSVFASNLNYSRITVRRP